MKFTIFPSQTNVVLHLEIWPLVVAACMALRSMSFSGAETAKLLQALQMVYFLIHPIGKLEK